MLRGYGRGGVPVRHRQPASSAGGGSGGGGGGFGSGFGLPLYHDRRGRPRPGPPRRRLRRGGGGGGGGRRERQAAHLARLGALLIGALLFVLYLCAGSNPGSGGVEDYDAWKQGRDEMRRERQQRQQMQKEDQDGWDSPVVHIVNSRFMQSQGSLTTLAWARLHLFRAFCLSTMVAQTTQDFLWIIKTDPDLDPGVRDAMVELLRPYPNYYLVGSETNYLIGHEGGAWRGGVEGSDLLGCEEEGRVFTGDAGLLRRAHAARDSHLILETRLDADDGLVAGYLEHVQRNAMELFGEGGTEGEAAGQEPRAPPRWLYWCSRQNAEWFADPATDVGITNAVQHSRLCVTPGITIGFAVGTAYEEVPMYEHTRIIKDMPNDAVGCGLEDKADCAVLVGAFPMMAIRSRTPTSAGMMGIHMEEKDALSEESRLVLWKMIQSKYFGIDADDVRRANRFIQENIVGIARDNIKGQCTPGHSCKLSSKELLQRLTEEALLKWEGVNVDEPEISVFEEES